MTGSFDESTEFRMREVPDDPEALRLVISGELDLAVAEMFRDRLRVLRDQGYAVRLDLAELDFIDSSGMRALLLAVRNARSEGWRLEIDPQITEPVRRAIELAGLHSQFWPHGG
jgi:anti-sigma B factor antagonist